MPPTPAERNNWPLEDQMQWPLVHIKSLQDAGGALVAESGCFKIVQVRAVAAIRRANTQTSGHPAQQSQQRAVAVLPTGDRSEQQHQENNTALATSSVYPRTMQAVRNGCGKKPLKPEKEICACGDVLGFLMVTSSGHFLAACRDMLPLPLKPGFVLRDDWGEMVVLAGSGCLAGGMARLGRCVHNRRHALQMAKAEPGARVASLVWPLKPPRGEEDRYYQARLNVRKVREPVPSEARSSRCGWLGVGSKRLACARCK
ncbi:hypothetical protein, conserved in T. vivax [Trypanosoma vivax Y486]|uniref:Uncharacterized protein n=1 Tax=Trypanosoma vivax (strain Y486) TaxID=1055687 RepID=F9WSM1_TRYVY|nr:hypothetical protein, conserved in T. vivax [Trypanosoma vivax Y486]|eukprot:CCD20560.1 hypothetical protein, conserved in T. vivax [Trypanosoma vivax Y486]